MWSWLHENRHRNIYIPLWCHLQHVLIQICLSCFIMFGVKKAREGRHLGTRDVKNNYLDWSVIYPDETENVSHFRRRYPTGLWEPGSATFLFGLKTHLSINQASIQGRAVRRQQSSRLSCEQPTQTNSFRLQRWQRSFWVHLWKSSTGRQGTHSFMFSSLSLSRVVYNSFIPVWLFKLYIQLYFSHQ